MSSNNKAYLDQKLEEFREVSQYCFDEWLEEQVNNNINCVIVATEEYFIETINNEYISTLLMINAFLDDKKKTISSIDSRRIKEIIKNNFEDSIQKYGCLETIKKDFNEFILKPYNNLFPGEGFFLREVLENHYKSWKSSVDKIKGKYKQQIDVIVININKQTRLDVYMCMRERLINSVPQYFDISSECQGNAFELAVSHYATIYSIDKVKGWSHIDKIKSHEADLINSPLRKIRGAEIYYLIKLISLILENNEY